MRTVHRPFRPAAKERRTYRGEVYASLGEARYAAVLDLEVKAGSVLWWIRQPRFVLGCPENVYRADFLVVPTHLSYRIDYVVDVKARTIETREFRKVRKLWKSYGPCPLWVVRIDGANWLRELVDSTGNGRRYHEALW